MIPEYDLKLLIEKMIEKKWIEPLHSPNGLQP